MKTIVAFVFALALIGCATTSSPTANTNDAHTDIVADAHTDASTDK